MTNLTCSKVRWVAYGVRLLLARRQLTEARAVACEARDTARTLIGQTRSQIATC